jgi:hypothetical protein
MEESKEDVDCEQEYLESFQGRFVGGEFEVGQAEALSS